MNVRSEHASWDLARHASAERVHQALQQSFRADRAAVLATLTRRVRDLQLAEDAVQDAYASAVQHWPENGIPDQPAAWLRTTAWRKAVDTLRREARSSPHAAPELIAPSGWPTTVTQPSLDGDTPLVPAEDDLLVLVLTCAHPALDIAAQVALTLRHVAGLTDLQTAQRMLVAPAAMAKRLVRARAKIKASRVSFELPTPADLPSRLDVARTVTYLLFTQGYSTGNPDPAPAAGQRRDAITLGRQLHRLVPHDQETTGLLALMLLHDARAAARTSDDGDFVPFESHERVRYDQAAIAEGRALLAETAIAPGELGSFQIQAAIAAVHTVPERVDDIDWELIADLYEVLARIDPSPVVQINRAVAVARAHNARAAVDILAPLLDDPRLASSVALHAAHAHILADLGATAASDQAFAKAIHHASTPTQRQYLRRRWNRSLE